MDPPSSFNPTPSQHTTGRRAPSPRLARTPSASGTEICQRSYLDEDDGFCFLMGANVTVLSGVGFDSRQGRDKMSRRNGNMPKLDLKLNLSPPRVNRGRVNSSSPSRSATVSPTSPPSSCVSLEANNVEDTGLRYSSSPEATSMVLAGCPRCLMYVMLSEEDPKCPKCKSPVMLDFLHDYGGGNNSKGGSGNGNNSGRRNKRN